MLRPCRATHINMYQAYIQHTRITRTPTCIIPRSRGSRCCKRLLFCSLRAFFFSLTSQLQGGPSTTINITAAYISSKYDRRHTQKHTYSPIFTNNVWSCLLFLFTMVPRKYCVCQHRHPAHPVPLPILRSRYYIYIYLYLYIYIIYIYIYYIYINIYLVQALWSQNYDTA